ncbi:c-type cytochrome [Pyxidicoccus xibeiensis]|uniref:c-type cytochrome n=1 Tax=Pyxidicoccus xibeiensis TaxID=2906759 RepID=UPI0020A8271F|nr:c-type cytochrome [Pyxidicoccus xibeiensis]MCP3136544.1 c-type cytochrome [Pyxidicoccus xibeiensis]
MQRTHLLQLLLLLSLPGVAAAQDGGRTAFDTACARCHTADTAEQHVQKSSRSAAKSQRDEPVRGPQLSQLLQKRTPEQLRAWIAAPNAVRKDTRCDTRLLGAGDLDLVLGYLATSAQPPPPPRDELLRQQFNKELAERRAQKQRKANHPSTLPQGRKR